jgi:hypothetical protein
MAVVSEATAKDFVRLRNGQVIQGAILRQDSAVVVLTSWEDRRLLQPPLQVFEKQEIESVWFVNPSELEERHIHYSPHVSGYEFGGGLVFQSWAETYLARRQVLQFSIGAGYTITSALGLELSGDFTIPFGGKSDTVWSSYDGAYHVMMNVVGHPIRWKGIVPFASAGGGAAIGIPVNGVTLVSSKDIRSLVDIGLGIKWGADHVGVRAELRHHFYTWTPDAIDEFGRRVPEQTADASQFKIGLFYFR